MKTPDANRNFYTRELHAMLKTADSEKLSLIYHFARALLSRRKPVSPAAPCPDQREARESA